MILLVFFNYVNINLIVLERKDINEYIILKESAELDNLLKKDDKILIYFYQKDCMACNDFKGILNEVIVDKKLQVYGVDLNKAGRHGRPDPLVLPVPRALRVRAAVPRQEKTGCNLSFNEN